MRSGESIFQYVTYFYFHCVLFFLVNFPSALDFAPHSAKELSFVVPGALLLVLVVVAVAAVVPATGAPPRLHHSRQCQRAKKCLMWRVPYPDCRVLVDVVITSFKVYLPQTKCLYRVAMIKMVYSTGNLLQPR